MEKLIYLALGSLAGGYARYGLAGMVHGRMGTGFPHGTLAVNLSGCFVIGILNGLAGERFLLGPNARILLMTGFCGAFTTFSTLILETSNLTGDGETLLALLNIAASLIFGFLLFKAGGILARII